MGATVSASIRLAAEQHGCGYGTKEDIFTHPKCPEPTRDAANPLVLPIWSATAGKYLVPEDLFVIQYPGPKPRFFAVEIDRRTECINSDTAKTAMAASSTATSPPSRTGSITGIGAFPA